MRGSDDSISDTLYITLACLSGLMGTVLLPIGILTGDSLPLGALRVAVALILLAGCYHSSRAVLRARAGRRSPTPPSSYLALARAEAAAFLGAARSLDLASLFRRAARCLLDEARRLVGRAGDAKPAKDTRADR